MSELEEFASLMVDEVIARVRVQLDAGEGLSIGDQKHMLEQLIKDRERASDVRWPKGCNTVRWLADAVELIRECRLADSHAARTGDEQRFDRAFHALCQFERQAKPILAALPPHGDS